MKVIAPSKSVRVLPARGKARWDEFQLISDKPTSQRMKRSVKGVDKLNEAVKKGVRQTAKKAIHKGNGVVTPFWTPELTKPDVMVQQCRNERKRDARIRWRRKVLADTATRRWEDNMSRPTVTDPISRNLVKSIYAPRPLTSPVLVVDRHPRTKCQQHRHWHWQGCAGGSQRRHRKRQICKSRAPGMGHLSQSGRHNWK
ncbi:unnamed protein product [Trypanosoma congolense IL3000]|uniref:WGS project CAEQ00000000 data, annotated contig 2256 n=1 Tax=Trypanosoma congolense (strain IL3000) TaxID=1068625 RepID=F9WCP5_TRYCI|nr:unnamed protein product [Trypanosoma congolense IL3000]